MGIVRWGLLLLPSLALFGCAPRSYVSANPPTLAPQAARVTVPLSVLPPVGQDYTGSITFLNRSMALPEGRWKVAATQAIVNKTLGVVGGVMALVRIEGTTLGGVLFAYGNSRPTANGMPLSPVCQSTDIIWNDVRQAVPQGEQDCAIVGFERPALWRSAPQSAIAGVTRQLDLLNVQPPNYLVYVMVHEANRNWSLGETLYENPDAAGIAPDMSTQRALSSWTAFRVASDPARRHFVDDLKARAAPLRLALRRQIETHAPYIPHSGLTPA